MANIYRISLAPLYKLLHKQTRWCRGKEQEDAFQNAKSQLTSTKLLVHFDLDKELVLSCEASPYGVGAVLAHCFEDSVERHIMYAFRSLASAVRRYSQLDKEGLAIIFAVKTFHHYSYGRQFTV